MINEFKSFYKIVSGGEGDRCKYPTRLDLYGCGCQHDCSYCYAKSLLSFRGLWNAETPNIADISKVIKKIERIPNKILVRLGGMTDCFQPLEKSVRNTYYAIKELNKWNKPYLIVTKSHIVADEEYLKILNPKLAHIQVSVTTTDDSLSIKYEKASLPSQRIKAIETLFQNGFDVQLRLSPFIPEYVDFEILNSVKCDKILIEFLRVNTWIRRWFDIDYSKHTLKEGGYAHLPLGIKLDLLSKITDLRKKQYVRMFRNTMAIGKKTLMLIRMIAVI
jgi:DNA repair photolyase